MINKARFFVDMTGTCVDCRSVFGIITSRDGKPGEEDPDVHLP